MYQIQKFFGVGIVSSRQNRSICVSPTGGVTKTEDLLNVIIPHFTAYPLLSMKYSDFVLWSKVIRLMETKQHLTFSGLSKVVSYYACINLGASPAVLESFPQLETAAIELEKSKPILPVSLNPYWVSGFTAGDGGFSIGIRKITGQIYFRFHIAQHSRDIALMNMLILFFGCGKVNLRDYRCDFYVQDFSKISAIIIPHFCEYPLYNIKSLDFLDFQKAVELFKVGGTNNTKDIENIISNMNSKREHK